MNRLIAWFASNSVAANLLMIFVIVAGIASVNGIRQEVFPNVAFDIISVSVPYPGAAPDEVEESLCIPIEEATSTITSWLHTARRWTRSTRRSPGGAVSASPSTC